MHDLLIRGGQVITPHGIQQLDVVISKGIISELVPPGTSLAAKEQVDVGGLYILPGLIDAHVHMREPGYLHKESMQTGTAAAACGGVTTVLDMPNTLPPVSGPGELAAKAALISGRAHVDIGLYALLGSSDPATLQALAAAGAIGFKLFLGPTTGDLRAPEWGELLAIGPYLAELGLPVVVHAEDRSVIEYWQPRSQQVGNNYAQFMSSRPAFGELAATAQACLLAGLTGAHMHVAHVSLARALDYIEQAKAHGWPVSAEACLPHLFLTNNDYPAIGNKMKVLPPVRTADDQAALWQGLHAGALDIVATDHAPHTDADKAGSIWQSASGAPGVETLLPLMLNAAANGRCTLCDIVRWCSYMPAHLFALPGKGVIAPGYQADMVFIDMQAEWQVQPEQLHSRSAITPFAGFRGKGRVVDVYLHGQLVARDGELTGAIPSGRWLRPARQSYGEHI